MPLRRIPLGNSDMMLELSHPVSIAIVGGGIAGLAFALAVRDTDHEVTLFEAEEGDADLGGGVQLTPNALRTLWRFGLKAALEEVAVKTEAIVYRRYDGRLIGGIDATTVEDEYDAPLLTLRHADLHRILRAALPAHFKHRTARVAEVLPPGTFNSALPGRAGVRFDDGTLLEADLVVGADGPRSVTRKCILGGAELRAAIVRAGAAYRAVIPVERILADPELRELPGAVTYWMGPRSHVVGYSVSAMDEYHLDFSTAAPEPLALEQVTWGAPAQRDNVKDEFAAYDQRVQNLMDLLPAKVSKWKLVDQTVSRWTQYSGRIVLVGDACHAMLPFTDQGPAMAIEDADVLGALLADVRELDELQSALMSYEALRRGRCAKVQAYGRMQEKMLRLPDSALSSKQKTSDKENMRANARANTKSASDAYQREELPQPKSEQYEAKSAEWARGRRDVYGYDAEIEVGKWRSCYV